MKKIRIRNIALLLSVIMLCCLTAGCNTTQTEEKGKSEPPITTPSTKEENKEIKPSTEPSNAPSKEPEEESEKEPEKEPEKEQFPLEELGWTYEDGLYRQRHIYVSGPGEKPIMLDMYSEDGIYWYADGELFMIYDPIEDSLKPLSSEEVLAMELLNFDIEELKNIPHSVHTYYNINDEEYKSSLDLSSDTMYSGNIYHSTSNQSFRIYKTSIEEECLANEEYVITDKNKQEIYSYDTIAATWTKKTENGQVKEDVLNLINELVDVEAEEIYDEEEGTSYIVYGTLSNETARKLAETSPYIKAPNAKANCQLEFDEDKKFVSFSIRIYPQDNFSISGLHELNFESLTLENDTIEGFKQEHLGIFIDVYMYDENYMLTVPAYVLNEVGELDITVPSWVSKKVPCYDFHANLFWEEDNKELVIPMTGKEGWYFDITTEEDDYVVAYVDTSNGVSEQEDYEVSYMQESLIVGDTTYEDIKSHILPSWASASDTVEFEHNGRTGFYYVTTGYATKGLKNELVYFVLQDIGYNEYVKILIHTPHVVSQEEAEKEALNVIKNFLLDM